MDYEKRKEILRLKMRQIRKEKAEKRAKRNEQRRLLYRLRVKNAKKSVPLSVPPVANSDTVKERTLTSIKKTNDNRMKHLSKEEKRKAKRREAVRRWREKLKSDPKKLAIYKEKLAIYKEKERLRKQKMKCEVIREYNRERKLRERSGKKAQENVVDIKIEMKS